LVLANRIKAVSDFLENDMDRRYTIYIFVWDDEVFERISKAKTDNLRVLYQIVFDAKEVSSWWRTRILRFDGFDFAKGSSDYNSLEESEFGSWLLNVGNKWDSVSAVSRNLFVVVQKERCWRQDFKWSRDLQNGKRLQECRLL
jgi:hypothetical protein